MIKPESIPDVANFVTGLLGGQQSRKPKLASAVKRTATAGKARSGSGATAKTAKGTTAAGKARSKSGATAKTAAVTKKRAARK
jgi:hypothetical protein